MYSKKDQKLYEWYKSYISGLNALQFIKMCEMRIACFTQIPGFQTLPLENFLLKKDKGSPLGVIPEQIFA